MGLNLPIALMLIFVAGFTFAKGDYIFEVIALALALINIWAETI